MDIGTHSVKLAQVRKENHHWSLQSYVRLPLPEATDSTNLISDVVESFQEQSDLFSMFRGRKAACVLPMSLVDLQSLSLPEGTEEETRLMIEQELTSSNSLLPGEVEYAWWRNEFSRRGPSETTELTVTSAPLEPILSLARALQSYGRYCEVMNVLPFALSRAVQLMPVSQPESPVAVFDWSSSTPLFLIVQNGFPIFTRVFRYCGYQTLTKPLQAQLGLTHQESCQLLKAYQSDSFKPLSDTIRQAIETQIRAPLKLLEREFGKTLNFVKSQRKDLWPKQLWLTGTGSTLNCVEQHLSKTIQISTAVWNLNGREQLETDQQREEAILQAEFAAAIALSSLAYES